MRFLSLVTVFFTFGCFAQTLPIGQSGSICPGDTLLMDGSLFDSTRITLLDNPVILNLQNNTFSPLISLGFNFVFYGNTYNQVAIGTNGVVSFNSSDANGICVAAPTTTIPNVNSPHKNCIMAPWMEIQSQSNAIQYQQMGVAPNRRFIVYYEESNIVETSDSCWNIAIVLNESTNIIEIFSRSLEAPFAAVEGIQNSTGTIAHVPTGYNYGEIWSHYNTTFDAKKWTPNGVNSYLVASSGYQFIVNNPYDLYWSINQNDTFSIIPFSDSLEIIGDYGTGIFVIVVAHDTEFCGSSFMSLVPIPYGSIISTVFHPPYFEIYDDYCNSGSGLAYTSPTGDSLFYWPTLNVYNDSLTGLVSGDYPVIYQDVNGCILNDTITISNNNTISVDTIYNSACVNISNGWASLSPYHPLLTDYELIDSNLNSIPYQSGLLPGTYTCVLHSPVGCSDSVTFAIAADNDFQLIDTIIQPTSCIGSADGSFSFSSEGGSPPYSSYWNVAWYSGEETFDSLTSGVYNFYIWDSANVCSFNIPITINEPDPIEAIIDITVVNSGSDGAVSISVSGGTPPYSFFMNGITQTDGEFNQLTSGNHTCVITDQNGCETTINFYVSALNMEENVSMSITAFPNPTDGEISLKGTDLKGTEQLFLFSTFGKLVCDLGIQAVWSGDGYQLQIGKMPMGVYYLVVVTENETKTLRIMLVDKVSN